MTQPLRILFLGTGEIGLPTLRWLLASRDAATLVGVVTQPDQPVGRRQILTPPPTKTLAQEHGVPVLQPVRIRQPEAVAALAALRPDVIVVIAYGQILPREILQMPRLACLNLHASLLPAHRGAAPIQAAILAGDAETGMTVMWMDEGLDTGDILLRRALPIRRRETGGELHDRLAGLGPVALADALALFQNRATGEAIPRQPQDNAKATYAAKLSRESGVVAWGDPAERIERLVCAMNPWPAASTTLPGRASGAIDGAGGASAPPPPPPRKLKVFTLTAQPLSGDSAALPGSCPVEPGTVLRADKSGILVATGTGETAAATGAALITELQLEGKRRMAAHEFLTGHPLAVGTRLGP